MQFLLKGLNEFFFGLMIKYPVFHDRSHQEKQDRKDREEVFFELRHVTKKYFSGSTPNLAL
jgi:hypothetical protein